MLCRRVQAFAAGLHLLHALDEGAEGFDLHSKDQISELSISKEHDEEHYGESHDVFGTSAQSGGQLSHGLIETDVLENLQAQSGEQSNSRRQSSQLQTRHF